MISKMHIGRTIKKYKSYNLLWSPIKIGTFTKVNYESVFFTYRSFYECLFATESEWSYQTTKYENCIDVRENDFIGAHLQNHVKIL
jgi:hypothetical protein